MSWRTLLAASAAVVLTACSGSSGSSPQADRTPVLPSPTPTPTETIPPVPPPPPPQRACYRLGYDEALAPTSDKKPADCTQLHTAVAFYVGSYPKSLSVDGKAVRTCSWP